MRHTSWPCMGQSFSPLQVVPFGIRVLPEGQDR